MKAQKKRFSQNQNIVAIKRTVKQIKKSKNGLIKVNHSTSTQIGFNTSQNFMGTRLFQNRSNNIKLKFFLMTTNQYIRYSSIKLILRKASLVLEYFKTIDNLFSRLNLKNQWSIKAMTQTIYSFHWFWIWIQTSYSTTDLSTHSLTIQAMLVAYLMLSKVFSLQWLPFISAFSAAH